MNNNENIVYLLGDKDINKELVLKSLGINEDKNEYNINTKYYKSKLIIKTIHLDKDNVDNNENSDIIESTAFLLALDSSNIESFELIKSYIKNNKKSIIRDDDNNNNNNNEDDQDDEDEEEFNDINTDDTLYILIDVNKSNSNSIEDKIEEWCIENLIEFVILDTKSHSEYDIRKSDLTELDPTIKYGIERIQEILESNMWPNMELLKNDKKQQQQQQQSNVEKDLEDYNEDDDFSSIKDNKFLQDSIKKIELLFKDNNKKKESSSSSSSSKTNNNNNNNNNKLIIEDPENEDNEDDDIAIFENTFKELQILREHMKTLPDDQRRDAAAKIALMFMDSNNQ